MVFDNLITHISRDIGAVLWISNLTDITSDIYQELSLGLLSLINYSYIDAISL